jgi:DNA-directed RNA polymerase subunit RPC12/RpoP
LEFFRRCPNCGKRFVVKVDKEVLVGSENDTVKEIRDFAMPRTTMGGGAMMPVGAVTVEIPIERDTFEVTYECKHCHHQWKETLVVVKKEKGRSKNDSITHA